MNRLRTADIVAGAGGLALLLALLAPWYSFGPVQASAFETLGILDVLLTITGLMGVAVPVLTVLRESPSIPIAIDVLTTWVAFLVLLVLLFRVISPPAELDRDWGLWLGLVAHLVTLAGAYLAMRDQSAPGLRPNPQPRRMPAP